MHFPPFWAKGTHGSFTCWRWSDASLEEAATQARAAASNLAARFATGNKPSARYGYGNRPLREPVLRELKNDSDEVIAAITRNSYGCQVLNTARVMFVDVDLPEDANSGGGFFKKLFGKAEPPRPNPAEAEALARAQAWLQQKPDWGWRVYRTRAGLRFLATHALFDPANVHLEKAFDELAADPLYRQLCKTQSCYRARLTPKPWRCGVRDRPASWPWADAKSEASFKQWEGRYQKACAEQATCALVSVLGNPQIHPDVQAVVSVHDEATRATSKLPLA